MNFIPCILCTRTKIHSLTTHSFQVFELQTEKNKNNNIETLTSIEKYLRFFVNFKKKYFLNSLKKFYKKNYKRAMSNALVFYAKKKRKIGKEKRNQIHKESGKE